MRIALVLVCIAAMFCTSAAAARASTYCSRSGDLCYGITSRPASVQFQLTLIAKYFSRYRICVRPPRGATTCRSFPVKRSGPVWGGTVRWERNFPNRGAGLYRVTWRHGTGRMGPALSFRRAS